MTYHKYITCNDIMHDISWIHYMIYMNTLHDRYMNTLHDRYMNEYCIRYDFYITYDGIYTIHNMRF